MTDFNYKTYSLNKLEEWVHDALSSGEATAQEVYDTIKKVVKETQEYHQKNEKIASDLLSLLNGHSLIQFNYDNMNYCGYGNTSDYCNYAWNDFWGSHSELSIHSDDVITFNTSPKKWVLPVQQKIEEGIDDYYVQFPDDLLEAANLKENDQVQWVDNGDGSYTLKKL